MVVEKEKFEQYLNILLNEVLFVDSAFKLYVFLQNKRVDRIEELNMAPAFFQIVMKSLMNSTVIGLSRIYENYDGKKRSQRNLSNFLNFVEVNLDMFPIEFKCYYAVDLNSINSHRSMIDEQTTNLKHLFVWRDKYHAHFDKKYFHDPNDLAGDAPLTIGHFRYLINLAHEILNDYSVAYSGSSIAQESTNLYDFEYILDILHDYKNNL